MVTTVGIPAPTDSYDHENCTKANLTSIRALIAAFDSSMDSLHDSINHQIARLDGISERAARCEEEWRQVKEGGGKNNSNKSDNGGSKVLSQNQDEHAHAHTNAHEALTTSEALIRVICPSAYDDAINTTRTRIRNASDKSNSSQNKNSPASTADTILNPHMPIESAVTRARSKANSAIRTILREEAQTFEATAKPSDAWLDRGSGFDTGIASREALRMNSVPPLLVGVHNSVKVTCNDWDRRTVAGEEINYYKDCYDQNQGVGQGQGLGSKERNHSQTSLESRKNNPSMDMNTRTSSGMRVDSPRTLTDEGSILMNQSQMSMSEQTGRNTIYTNYSEGTASHRRRQRKQKLAASASASRRRNNLAGAHVQVDGHRSDGYGHGNSHTRGGGHGNSGFNINAGTGTTSSSRQHLMSGSLPYICEMIHDTHRLGTIRGAHIFPPVENVCDLFISGTKELAYSCGQDNSDLDERRHAGGSRKNGNGSQSKKRQTQRSGGNVAQMSRKSSSELFQLAESQDE